MTRNFGSVAEAVAADVKHVRLRVFVGGRALTTFEAHASHGVNQPIGTCTVVTEAPLPSFVTPNASVLVQAGYPGAVRTIFSGRLPNHEAAISEQGRWGRINAVGWASLLDYKDFADLRFAGPISLKRLFQALCKRRRVPSYRGEDVLTYDGASVQFGGITEIDEGDVVIDRTVSPLTWLTQKAELFGYRVYDTPIGRVMLSRVSGLPGTTAAATYAEGENAYRFSSRLDTRGMVTYWEVFGAKYTAAAGNVVAIRSIPAEVPYSAELDPPGYRMDAKRDEILTSTALADAVRNVLEINTSEPSELATWEVDGAPDRQPGDVVALDSDTCQVSGNRWLMSVRQSVTDRTGYYATMEGWAGAGEALPAGDDCESSSVSSSTYHVGDSTIAWFSDPSPDGTTVEIAFTVPEAYSSLTIYGEAHGANSYFASSDNDESTASRFEIWQVPDPTQAEDDTDNKLRKVGDGQLPIMEETAGVIAWQQIVIPITGSVKAGPAELHLVAGTDADTGAVDDFEVRGLTLVACGVGEPELPEEAY
jgi:hypothetical protein